MDRFCRDWSNEYCWCRLFDDMDCISPKGFVLMAWYGFALTCG